MHHFSVTRRDFLQGSIGAALLLMCGCSADDPLAIDGEGNLAGTGLVDPFAGGEFQESLPFLGEGSFPVGVRESEGLDGRLALDLSRLDSLQVSNEDFFIRTFPPEQLSVDADWSVKLHGLVDEPVDVGIEQIRKLAEPQGSTLMECAGNGLPAHFGLISSAEWSGVPLAKILELAKTKPEAKRLLISGFDGTPPRSTHSSPGASWVFTPQQLQEAGAFLAVEMNGAALSIEHGAPVRLVVPGWYGCTCVKWLEEIKWVDNDEPATSQMQEFAQRTHQEGVPKLARDYSPASVDRTAAPIRVERWQVDGKPVYRVVGLTWGAEVASGELGISFRPREDYQTLTACPPLTSPRNWTFWSHRWEPESTGNHRIRLKLLNSNAPTRRLDMKWYVRNVNIPEVV